jgi:hypothetical protein
MLTRDIRQPATPFPAHAMNIEERILVECWLQLQELK